VQRFAAFTRLLSMERIRRAAIIATGLAVAFSSLAYVASAQDAPATTKISLTPVTSAAGLMTRPTMTFGALWADYDRDGDPDLFIDRHYQNSWLHTNQRGRYGLHPDTFLTQNHWRRDTPWVDRHGCAWGEATGGGGPDLFCTQGANKGEGAGANQVFSAVGSRFHEAAVKMGVADPKGRGRGANWLDYDNDGDLDLLVTNAIRAGYPNRLYRNDRGVFRKVAAPIAPSKTEWPTSTVADWNNDGGFDIMVLDGMHGIQAYSNEGGRFVRTTLAGIPDEDWISATWGDYDGDGWIDIHLISRTRAVVAKNLAGSFVVVDDRPVTFGRTSAWFDVENDGDLDLFVVQAASPPAGVGNPNHPDFMLVNDAGLFTKVTDASFRGPRTGNGDQVITSDYDRDGRTDLFVTNGHNPSRFNGPSELLRNTTAGGNSISVRLSGDRWNPMGIGTRIHVRTPTRTWWYIVTDGVTHRGQSEVENVVLGLGAETSAAVTIHWATGERDCYDAEAGSVTLAKKGSARCEL
jgi:hypothetical protein